MTIPAPFTDEFLRQLGDRLKALVPTQLEREEIGELVRGYRQARLLSERGGSYQRLPGCRCTWEEGDSPCPVHGEHEEAPPAETKP